MSCGECGPGVCPDATFGPVGIRCRNNAGAGRQRARPAKRAAPGEHVALPERAVRDVGLDGIDVGIFLAQLAEEAGTSVNSRLDLRARRPRLAGDHLSGKLIRVAEGEYWRHITSAFLHANILHLGLNMLVLWIIGPALEEFLGHGRYVLLYVVSGLAGAAGALVVSPGSPAVGASGAIWGDDGRRASSSGWRKIYVFGGQAMGLLVFNLLFHVPDPRDLIGGPRRARRRRRGVVHLPYLRRSPALATISAVAVGAASVAVALAQVGRGSR